MNIPKYKPKIDRKISVNAMTLERWNHPRVMQGQFTAFEFDGFQMRVLASQKMPNIFQRDIECVVIKETALTDHDVALATAYANLIKL